MKSKYTPGDVMPPDKNPAIASPEPCKHKNLVPLEFRFAKVKYQDGYAKTPFYDYATTIMTANICRVKLYFCLDCNEEIEAPKRKE